MTSPSPTPAGLLDVPEGPSSLVLDLYAVGEATETEQATVHAWLDVHPDGQRALEVRTPGFVGQPGVEHRAMAARVEQRLHADRQRARRPGRVDRFAALRRWLLPSVTFAAAAVAVVVSVRGPAPTSPSERVWVKGALGVDVFRARDGRVEPIISGARVRAGDRLRFRPTALPAEGQLLVIGADAAGPLYGFAPAGATTALPVSALDAEGALPGASVLDDARGETWAHLVWCPTPFALVDVARHASPDRLVVPSMCRQSAVHLARH